MSGEGTPIDAIENGEVTDAADSQHMQAILAEMNASGADIANGPGVSQPQVPQPRPPMRPNAVMPQRQYIDDDEDVYMPPPQQRKHSSISRGGTSRSILDRVSDPIFVAFLVFVLSLPVLHTYLARYAGWAFAIGGQLSWLGLIALSLLGGTLFGIYRASRDILGL